MIIIYSFAGSALAIVGAFLLLTWAVGKEPYPRD